MGGSTHGHTFRPVDKKIYDSFQSVDRPCHAWGSLIGESYLNAKARRTFIPLGGHPFRSEDIHLWLQRPCCLNFTLVHDPYYIRTKSTSDSIGLTVCLDVSASHTTLMTRERVKRNSSQEIQLITLATFFIVRLDRVIQSRICHSHDFFTLSLYLGNEYELQHCTPESMQNGLSC